MATEQVVPVTNTGPSLEARSFDAFYRNLPMLLKKHCGKWVAYHGDELIGVAGTKRALYRKGLGLGLKASEFVVLFADKTALNDREEIELPRSV